jgi:hypothetical protein
MTKTKTNHKLYRRRVGPITQAPYPWAEPQYLTGPRHGQQVALLRRALDGREHIDTSPVRP